MKTEKNALRDIEIYAHGGGHDNYKAPTPTPPIFHSPNAWMNKNFSAAHNFSNSSGPEEAEGAD